MSRALDQAHVVAVCELRTKRMTSHRRHRPASAVRPSCRPPRPSDLSGLGVHPFFVLDAVLLSRFSLRSRPSSAVRRPSSPSPCSLCHKPVFSLSSSFLVRWPPLAALFITDASSHRLFLFNPTHFCTCSSFPPHSSFLLFLSCVSVRFPAPTAQGRPVSLLEGCEAHMTFYPRLCSPSHTSPPALESRLCFQRKPPRFPSLLLPFAHPPHPQLHLRLRRACFLPTSFRHHQPVIFCCERPHRHVSRWNESGREGGRGKADMPEGTPRSAGERKRRLRGQQND